MIRPRLSIARMMAVVMIIGIDCALVRAFLSRTLWHNGVFGSIESAGLGGLLPIGLATSAGVLGWLCARGRLRRFAIGFNLSGLAMVLACIVLGVGFVWQGHDHLTQRLRPWLTSLEPRSLRYRSGGVCYKPTFSHLLILEAARGVPVLTADLTGGVLSLVVRRRETLNFAPDPAPL